MTNMLHDVKSRQPWLEPQAANLEPVAGTNEEVDLDDVSGDARATWSAPRQLLVGGIVFALSMAVGGLVMQWATTYQGHRAWFTPASVSLVIAFVVIAGSLELADAISHRRSAKAADEAASTSDAEAPRSKA